MNNKTYIFSNKFLNYLVYCFGFICLYLVISVKMDDVFINNQAMSTIVADIFMLLISVLLFYKRKYKQHIMPFQSKQSVSFKQITFWILYLVIVSFNCLTIFSYIISKSIDPSLNIRTDTFSQMSIVSTLVLSIVVAPVTEECMMRLFMYNQLKCSSSWITAMIVSSLVFAALHFTISHLILGTLLSINLTIAYQMTNNICVPIIGHMLYNIMTLFASSTLFYDNIFYVIIIFVFLIFLTVQGIVHVNLYMKSDK